MDRKIMIEFPDVKIKFCATMLDKEEPDLCDAFWKRLETPLKMACRHTLSTGERFMGEPRPPRHPVKCGTQANPIGKKKYKLCELEFGTIIYNGLRLEFAYGANSKLTEPSVSGGSVIAIVDKEGLDDFAKAGKIVWNAQYMTHRLVTMEARRKEE